MKKLNYIEVDISSIQCDDVIICTDGEIRTVNKNYIKYDKFMGISLFGDTYNLGTRKVKKVIL